MTIKFVCSCGKRLKARDEMARRRSFCPRCGQPVGIPSLQPTHPGTTAGPLSPDQRRRRAAESGAESAPAAAPARDRAGALLRALLTGRQPPGSRRPARALETRWYDYLAYPFHDWRLWAGPALLLTILSAAVLLLTPEVIARLPDSGAARWVLWLSGPVALFVAGYPCNFLGCVLRSAASGDGSALRWNGHGVGAALLAAGVALMCFLAGPAVPAAVAVAYWLRCGDPGAVDWVILSELGVLTVGYLLLVLASVSERGRLRDVNPLRVIDLAHRLRWRAAAVALAGSALAVGHGFLGVFAAENLHRNVLIGLPLLAACMVSGMMWATALFRVLGVWCYRSRVAVEAVPAPMT